VKDNIDTPQRSVNDRPVTDIASYNIDLAGEGSRLRAVHLLDKRVQNPHSVTLIQESVN